MKIAIVTPGFLPVPAVFGGAIEGLIETILKDNEHSQNVSIDLFTISSEKSNTYNFKNTKIIQVITNLQDKFISVVYNRLHMLVALFDKKQKGNYVSPYAVKINRLIKSEQYDYIVIENNLTVVNLLKKRPNLVFHLHNDIFGEDKPLYQCEIMLKSCCKVITVSDFMKQRLLTINKNADIRVLYNCVDFDLFSEKMNTVKQDNFSFLYSGRLVEEKGVLELLKAFLLVQEKYKNTKLIVIGKSVFDSQQYLTYYEELVLKEAKTNINNIIFTGFVHHDDIPQYLSSCDCVVIPTMCEEAFGIVALEAMAMKKAVISSNSGGLVEVLDKNCAIFVDRDNIVSNLYNAMIRVLENSEECSTMGENGYNRVHLNDKFDQKNYYNNFLEMLTE